MFSDRNECLEITCLNGGRCNNIINGFECLDCNAGWTGKICEIGECMKPKTMHDRRLPNMYRYHESQIGTSKNDYALYLHDVRHFALLLHYVRHFALLLHDIRHLALVLNDVKTFSLLLYNVRHFVLLLHDVRHFVLLLNDVRRYSLLFQMSMSV